MTARTVIKAVTLQKSSEKYFWFLKSSHFKCFSFSITIIILISIIVIWYIKFINIFSGSFLFRSFYLFAIFGSILLCVSLYFKFYPHWLIVFAVSLKYCITFPTVPLSCYIRTLGPSEISGNIQSLLSLLFCYYVLHELTQRRREKKVSFDDKFS